MFVRASIKFQSSQGSTASGWAPGSSPKHIAEPCGGRAKWHVLGRMLGFLRSKTSNVNMSPRAIWCFGTSSGVTECHKSRRSRLAKTTIHSCSLQSDTCFEDIHCKTHVCFEKHDPLMAGVPFSCPDSNQKGWLAPRFPTDVPSNPSKKIHLWATF